MTVREKLFNIVHENALFYNLETLETTDRAYFVTKYETRFEIEYDSSDWISSLGDVKFYKAKLYLDNSDKLWRTLLVVRCPHAIVVDAIHEFCEKYYITDFVYSFMNTIMIEYEQLYNKMNEIDMHYLTLCDYAMRDFLKDSWGEH